MNDATLTLVGNLVDEPRMRRTKTGHMVSNFRMASTARRKNNDSGNWEDISTLFVTVTCWRALAENVAESLHKGDPVVVTGRYYAREYTVEEVTRVSYELEATTAGHDLSRGVSVFCKKQRPYVPAQVELGADGLPADQSDRWLGVVDPNTGEMPAEPSRSGGLAAVS